MKARAKTVRSLSRSERTGTLSPNSLASTPKASSSPAAITPRSPSSPVMNPHSDAAEFDPRYYEMPTSDGLYAIQQQWHSYWTYGSKRTVAIIKCSCTILLLMLLLIIAAGVVLVSYKTYCPAFASYDGVHNVTMQTDVQFIDLTSSYTRGSISLKLANDINLISYKTQEIAIGTFAAPTSVPSVVHETSNGVKYGNFSLSEPPKFTVAGYDFSCHNGYMQGALPLNPMIYSMAQTVLNVIHSGAYGAIDIAFPSGVGNDQVFMGVATSTFAGNININNVGTSDRGIMASSTSGSITISNVNLNCADISYGDTSAALNAKVATGTINIVSATVHNCLTTINGGAGLVTVSQFTSSATSGTNSQVVISTNEGIVNLTNVQALDLSILTATGSVTVQSVDVIDGPFKVISTNGVISLNDVNVGTSGLIQIESVSSTEMSTYR